MAKMDFMIGKGELLTSPVKVKPRYGTKVSPYSFKEAVFRLSPQFINCSDTIDELPSEACPGNYAVELVTINPDYLAKSYYPANLFRALEVEPIGSKNSVVIPEKRGSHSAPNQGVALQIYLASPRDVLRDIPNKIEGLIEESKEADDLRKIESITVPSPVLGSILNLENEAQDYFEIGIHLLPSSKNRMIQDAFFSYVKLCSVVCFSDLSFNAGNLWFIPVYGTRAQIEQLAKFTFIRVIRKMPTLRSVPIGFRSEKIQIKAKLTQEPPVASDVKVAILDGGLPEQNPIKPWISRYYLSDSAAGDVPDYNEHGLGVSSAFLFGPLELGKVSKRPYAPITNIRILDADSARDNSLELYRALGVIEEVLLSKQYDFINLSLGPDLPIEDHDVHAWTSVIDEQLADGTTLMTIAAGNNGEADKESGNARIQVPSDCVNALAVGAADKESDEWLRAYYSAIGPGRIPGLVKPDLMAFGGVPGNYFHVLVEGNNPVLAPALGTSFAAPYLLRTAVGIKAYLGDSLSVLGIKTLLIHCSTPRNNPLIEVGWGKVPSDISNIILSPDGVSRIIYEGELTPAKYLRALIPLPEDLRGMVKIRATICFTTAVNPEDSGAYTRVGLEIHFRPNIEKVSPGSMHAQTKPFFSKGQYELEESLRELGGKWETVMSAEKNFRATTLKNPSFDIHCMARKNCGISTVKKKLRYALIISITTPKDLEVGQRILNRYPMLVPIRPRITIPTIQV